MIKVLGKENPHTHSAIDTLVSILLSVKDYPRALEFAKQVLFLRKKFKGGNNPSTLDSVYRMGEVLEAMKSF